MTDEKQNAPSTSSGQGKEKQFKDGIFAKIRRKERFFNIFCI